MVYFISSDYCIAHTLAAARRLLHTGCRDLEIIKTDQKEYFKDESKGSKTHSRLGGGGEREVDGLKRVFRRGLGGWNGKMDRDRRVRDVEKRKRRNTSRSEKERGDGYSTGEICSHHKGNIEERLGGNSSISASSSSSSSCPVFPSLIIPQFSHTTCFSSTSFCTLSVFLFKCNKAI